MQSAADFISKPPKSDGLPAVLQAQMVFFGAAVRLLGQAPGDDCRIPPSSVEQPSRLENQNPAPKLK